MELRELLESKIYVKDGSAMSFKSPAEYINPFLDRVSKLTNSFEVEGIKSAINKNEEDNTENVSYGRFLIEAVLPSQFDVEDCISKIGLIVALDNQKPLMKVYSGKDVRACMNLTIFNADNVFTQEMLGNTNSIYGKAVEYADKMEEGLEEFKAKVEIMKNTIYSGSTLNEKTGQLVKDSMLNSKLGHTVILQGFKEMLDSKSKYALKNGETTAWNYYNSITEFIKRADIADQPSKTVILSSLFLN